MSIREFLFRIYFPYSTVKFLLGLRIIFLSHEKNYFPATECFILPSLLTELRIIIISKEIIFSALKGFLSPLPWDNSPLFSGIVLPSPLNNSSLHSEIVLSSPLENSPPSSGIGLPHSTFPQSSVLSPL